MCDTILATPENTADGIMLFGKNSDRQRNEAQAVELFPAADHAAGSHVTCTHISIPQAQHTNGVFLSRPFWIWGAEMGANEHGVVIGNEGLNARGPAPEEPALTGMDLLRLALERAATAAEAVDVITTLLGQHGQGGNCGHVVPSHYHNGFMIADADQAFVLETVGREWLVERVVGNRAISNDYSIGTNAMRASSGLEELIRSFGSDDDPQLSYAARIGDAEKQHVGMACMRRERAATLMAEGNGQLRPTDMMAILRDHGETDAATAWDPQSIATKPSLCLHAGPAPRGSQTTGSMVSELRRDPVHWVTGTAAPCISIFKPVLLDVPLPEHGPRPSDQFDPRSLWWRHERLHRSAVMRNYPQVLEDITPERDALEENLRTRVAALLDGGNLADRAAIVAGCWRDAIQLEDRWLERIVRHIPSEAASYHDSWSAMNERAALNLSMAIADHE